MRVEKIINTNGTERRFITFPYQKSIFYIGKAGCAQQDFREFLQDIKKASENRLKQELGILEEEDEDNEDDEDKECEEDDEEDEI